MGKYTSMITCSLTPFSNSLSVTQNFCVTICLFCIMKHINEAYYGRIIPQLFCYKRGPHAKNSPKVLPNQFNCINLQQIYWQNNADYSLAWLNSGKIYKGQKSKSRQSDASLYKGRGLCFRLSRPKGFPEPAKRE